MVRTRSTAAAVATAPASLGEESSSVQGQEAKENHQGTSEEVSPDKGTITVPPMSPSDSTPAGGKLIEKSSTQEDHEKLPPLEEEENLQTGDRRMDGSADEKKVVGLDQPHGDTPEDWELAEDKAFQRDQEKSLLVGQQKPAAQAGESGVPPSSRDEKAEEPVGREEGKKSEGSPPTVDQEGILGEEEQPTGQQLHREEEEKEQQLQRAPIPEANNGKVLQNPEEKEERTVAQIALEVTERNRRHGLWLGKLRVLVAADMESEATVKDDLKTYVHKYGYSDERLESIFKESIQIAERLMEGKGQELRLELAGKAAKIVALQDESSRMSKRLQEAEADGLKTIHPLERQRERENNPHVFRLCTRIGVSNVQWR